jgi:hypothetical protein
LLAQRGRRAEAAELLSTLPAPKAYRFLQKLRLDVEAQALASRELARADEEGKPQARARWLELTEDFVGAAQAWEKAERRDKALTLWERVGDWRRVASLAETLSLRQKAVAAYEKLGDTEGLARAQKLPETPPAPVAPPPASNETSAAREAE